MRVAKFLLSKELLASALCLPEGSRILGVRASSKSFDYLEIFVEHEDLPDVRAGAPCIDPKIVDGKATFAGWS